MSAQILFFINEQPVLIYSPQGLSKSELDYHNIYPNTYKVCQSFDTEKPALVDASEIQNLDFDLNVMLPKLSMLLMAVFMLSHGLGYQILIIQVIHTTIKEL